MQTGIVGLGRIGSNMARRLMAAGHARVAQDIHPEAAQRLEPTSPALATGADAPPPTPRREERGP